MEKNILGNRRDIFFLILPGLAVFGLAILVPLVYSVALGMTDSAGYTAGRFLGMQNYAHILFKDMVFWTSLRNALLLAAGLVLVQHPLSIFFAILIDRVGGGRERWFRMLVFIPCMISIVVTTQMWKGILDADFGPLNKLLGMTGIEGLQRAWLSEPVTAIASMIVITMWQGFGWALLIYYAGIKGIPMDIYEAAKLDGATGPSAALRITVPLLLPVIRVNVTLAVISALKMMEVVFLTTGGGPGNSTQFIANYFYTKAFAAQEYGYANALSVLFVLICFGATAAINGMMKVEAYEF